jgi:hypothetical protein
MYFGIVVFIRLVTVRTKVWTQMSSLNSLIEKDAQRRDKDGRPIAALGYQMKRTSPHMAAWRCVMSRWVAIPHFRTGFKRVLVTYPKVSLQCLRDVWGAHSDISEGSNNYQTVYGWAQQVMFRINYNSMVYTKVVDDTTKLLLDMFTARRDAEGFSEWTGFSSFFGAGFIGSGGWC